ncbi:transcriptional regulator [Levilactobacillus senmaizukei DSM 21775 = NBRC 103853]|uniref:Transcriptional regulator n=1 Tax=Levilactobacillus senmaizukei DSM 21775 = NBRC 103853 TaxID=1423803 RepID=A0A0R2DBN6_9LACO|nr:MarR family transcriptional regulator [Levilactobacillus senmaizukei]KRN01471.1 transcriptional regulator [Levilactobacillus senmaizukei DSM 21775 = NBRC 103853]
MPNLDKQKNAAGKLIEFDMVSHTADELAHRNHADKDEHPLRFQGQGKILLALAQNNGLSQKELATRLNLAVQSTAEFVNKLVKKDLVTKEKSSTDRRKTIIRLTDLGRETAAETAKVPAYLEGLSDTELDQLTAILTKINQHLYEDIDQASPTYSSKFQETVADHLRDWFM